MIRRNELVPVGNVGKPHGLAGEMQLTIDPDVPLVQGDCLIFELDGIFVPFFVDSVRSRNSLSRLVKLDDVDSDAAASQFNGLTAYMTIEHVDSICGEDDDDEYYDGDDDDGGSSLYAGTLIGSTVVDSDGHVIGKILDINTSTANILFEVERSDGSEIFIPVAEEFIVSFDSDKSVLTLDLPEGLLESQS
ncbi:MAG: ribosome maturation factor RimM [Paramuribaculum sp.]|nr:16S rRNA processing protein RimM [Bacteroides sp.]MDE6825591.1 ribosome maturation factor RimM [Paramuribaculum sp.]MDE7471296.1 ribosome maturation factor RimM [Paramuribaculum sp.]